MSGNISGVRTRIMEKYPQAKFYTHYANHRLNLVIVASCKIPEIRNFMDSFQSLTFFFSYSAKRKAILRKHFKDGNSLDDLIVDIEDDDASTQSLKSGSSHQTLPKLSEKRWLSRVDSISTLLAHYSQIHDALHEVVLSSNGKSSSEAMSFIHSITQFSFIVCATISQYLLAIIRPLTVLLQKINIDLLTARKEAQVTLDTIKAIRNNDTFVIIYRRATGIAASLEVDPSLPRTAGKQKHRANAPSITPEEYYRKNMYLPFVDYIIQID